MITPKLTDEQIIENAIRQCPVPDVHRDAMAALERVKEVQARRSKILGLVQEALSQLRLDMKYLVFDLEATRRERDIYKQRLGE